MADVQAAQDEVGDCRIGEGGLLRRFELALHLTRLHWQLAALLAFTWLPIVLLGLRSGEPQALVYDPAIHVRLLIVAPILLGLDHLFPRLCRYTLAQLLGKGFIACQAQPRFRKMFQGARRASDSWLAEAILAILALGLGAAVLVGAVHIRGVSGGSLGPDRVWYALTDLPLFQFLLWRSVWRWAIWVRILAGLSRLQLDLVPTHPDRCGGIRILSLPSLGYCAMLLFALSSVLCAEWEGRATLGASLASFGPLLLVLAAGGTLIALGPLLLFAPQLVLAKRRGAAELGSLATSSGRQFRAALHEAPRALHAECVASLAAAEQTYRETVSQMTILLFDKKDLILLLAAALLPAIPSMLMYVPKEDWWAIGTLLTGWKP